MAKTNKTKTPSSAAAKPKHSSSNPPPSKSTISNKSRPPMKSKGGPASGRSTAPQPSKKNNRKRGSGSAKPQYSHFEQQRLDRLREKDERRAIKEEKLIARKKERTKKIKILTKKNRKGQPLMNGRMELLLEKIQKSM